MFVQTTLDGKGEWNTNKGAVVQGEILNLTGLAGNDFELQLIKSGLHQWAMKYRGRIIRHTEFYKGIPFGSAEHRFEKAVPYRFS